MRWNIKALALLLMTVSGGAMAQDAPPLPEGVQATGPAGTSGAAGSYDDVGYASIGTGTLVSVEAPGLAAGAFAEVTAIDSGRTILAESAGGSGPGITLSPAAAGQLGVTGDRIAVRVRQVDAPAVDAAALHAGRAASARMDAPPVLLTGLRTMLAAKTTPPTPIAATPSSAKPAAPTAKAPAPKPKPAAPAPAPAATGRYKVQVATFSTRDRAAGVAKAIGGTVQAAGRYFRVRLGPFATRAAAASARDGAAKRGYGDARVITD